jgi:hypothetical protein
MIRRTWRRSFSKSPRPADEACYTCHTNYAMFGGFRAKIHGLKHVFVHSLGTPPPPEAIKLYDPYDNRECLHCHESRPRLRKEVCTRRT